MARRAPLYAAIVLAAACTRDLDGPTAHTAPRSPSRRIAAVVELTIRNIGSPNMSTSAIVGSSVAEVEAIRAAQARSGAAGQARFDLTLPTTNGTTPGNATIQIEPLGVGASEANSTRYFQATYRVRNAELNGTALGSPRDNLTFIAVGSPPRTIGDTPLLVFNKADGSFAGNALTRELKPSGLVTENGGGEVMPVSSDVMQIFTEEDVAVVPTLLPDVTNPFPYGFVTHRVGPDSATNRVLPPNPAPDDFEGVVTFAFRMPLQTPSTDDPTTITVLMLALDDDVVAMTQSFEEQTPPGPTLVLNRAVALGAQVVRLLPGGSVPGLNPASQPTRLFCSVRTAGTVAAPTANLVTNVAAFSALSPSPYTAAGLRMPASTSISATFSSAVSGAGPTNFVVRGSISGLKFHGQAYSPSSGTTVTTPTGTFSIGEDVDVTLTESLSCPPWAGRLKVGVFQTSTVNLSGSSNPTVSNNPSALALGAFTGSAFLDVALRTGGTNAVVIEHFPGSGAFQGAATIPATGTNDNAGGIVAADFNGDGKLDLAFVNAGNLFVYLADVVSTAPTYTAVAGLPSVGTGPLAMAVGDFNGDGIPDLLITFANHVSVLLGTGTGGFQPPIVTSTGAGTRAAAIGDMNQDGMLDLVVVNNTGPAAGSITVEFGTGDGTFRSGASVTTSNLLSGLAIGDMNGDGHLDVVTADSTANTVSVRLGDGLGNVAATPTATGALPAIASSVAVADMNGSGTLDVVVGEGTTAANATITVLLSTITGGQLSLGAPIGGGSASGVHQIVTGNYNNSGNLSIFTPQFVTNNFRLYSR